jgi:hypothetical protein
MAVKKHPKRVYARAVPVLLVSLMLLTVSAAMYVSSAKTSHRTVDVVHGLFTPLSNLNDRNDTARIHSRKQAPAALNDMPSAGKAAGQALSAHADLSSQNTR